jgi:hypothetical protein
MVFAAESGGADEDLVMISSCMSISGGMEYDTGCGLVGS